MLFTATKQSRIFGGNMGIIGIIPGVPFLGASRTFDPTYPYDFFKDRYAIPYTQAGIAGIIGDLSTEPTRQAASTDLLNRRITQLQAAIASLEQFDRDNTAYYDERVNRTSGGKRDRLREERAALRAEGEAARVLASSAVRSLTNTVNAKATVAMQEAGNDPRQVVVARDPNSGALVYSRPTLPQNQTQSQGGLPSWLLPVGAAAAAYFALKG